MRGIVLANQASGSSAEPLDIPLDVRTVEPSAFAEALEGALADGAGWIGVAGGDGTIRTAAARLAGTDVVLVPFPAGTLNHFARQLGIDDIDKAVDAATSVETGHTERVDVGEVNGRVFVNNASVGLYPLMVARRDELHAPKRIAAVLALAAELRRARTVTVEVDGSAMTTWMVFVGNNRYGTGLFDLAWRESLDEGVLDVRLVRANARWSRVRVLAAVLAGRLQRSPLVECRQAAAVSIETTPARIDVALDGEVETLESPLCFTSRPRALAVPRGTAAGGAARMETSPTALEDPQCPRPSSSPPPAHRSVAPTRARSSSAGPTT